MKRIRALAITTLSVALFSSLLSTASAIPGGPASVQETALDRYIAKPDASYSWKLANTIVGEGFKEYVLDLRCRSGSSGMEALAHDSQTRKGHLKQSLAVHRGRQ